MSPCDVETSISNKVIKVLYNKGSHKPDIKWTFVSESLTYEMSVYMRLELTSYQGY